MEKLETVTPWRVDNLECYPQTEISVRARVDEIAIEFATGDTFLLCPIEVIDLLHALEEAQVKQKRLNEDLNVFLESEQFEGEQ